MSKRIAFVVRDDNYTYTFYDDYTVQKSFHSSVWSESLWRWHADSQALQRKYAGAWKTMRCEFTDAYKRFVLNSVIEVEP